MCPQWELLSRHHLDANRLKKKYKDLQLQQIKKLMELQSDGAVLNYLTQYNAKTDSIVNHLEPDVNLCELIGLRPFDPRRRLGRAKSMLAELKMAYEGVAVLVTLGNPEYVMGTMALHMCVRVCVCVCVLKVA